jgi:hypothetical protein
MKVHLFDLKSGMERNGIKMLDFLENNFKVDYAWGDLKISMVMFVQEQHICRPDLISWEAYRSVDYTDIILKFNQITNPFSMQIDDFLVIPDLDSGQRFYREDKLQTSSAINDTKALFLDPSKASKQDINRIKQLQKIASKRANGASEIKPTNLLRAGEVPYINNGKQTIFAPYISETAKLPQAKN